MSSHIELLHLDEAAASPLRADAKKSADGFRLSPRRIATLLALAIALLVAAHVALKIAQEHVGGLDRTMRLFDLDEEANLPTWYSTIALLAAGLLSAVIAFLGRRRHPGELRFWAGLAAGFAYLSIDELAMLHDKFGGTLATSLGVQGHGWTRYVWVVPALLAVSVLAITYVGFVTRLPARVRRLAILAGVLYVGGAVGCEMIGARLVALGGPAALTSAAYTVEVIVEETLEMTGVAVWIYAQLIYLVEFLAPRGLALRIGGPRTGRD